MLVEDNEEIIQNLKLLLELNDFDVITAYNGLSGIKLLIGQDTIPDVIVSDIMMDEMDGFDFFNTISMDERFNKIPFIFLSALSTPKDIRKGKMLGVDDYITKPFDVKDLLASIKGKINRYQKNKEVSEKVSEKLPKLEGRESPKPVDKQGSILMLTKWDDKIGPMLVKQYPTSDTLMYSTSDISGQLFNAATTIYGQGRFQDPEGILISLENINKSAYAYFDSYKDPLKRSGEVQYMFSIIAPSISYMQSLLLKKKCAEISNTFKKKKDIELDKYWEEIVEVLSYKE